MFSKGIVLSELVADQLSKLVSLLQVFCSLIFHNLSRKKIILWEFHIHIIKYISLTDIHDTASHVFLRARNVYVIQIYKILLASCGERVAAGLYTKRFDI